MKPKHLISLFSILICCWSCNTNTNTNTNTNEEKRYSIKVRIDYGGVKDMKEVDISVNRPSTALEVLQYAALVETHPVGKHVFVCAIDSVQFNEGVKAWYYEVNGKPTKKLAINQIVSPGDTISWLYKTDVCSRHKNDKLSMD